MVSRADVLRGFARPAWDGLVILARAFGVAKLFSSNPPISIPLLAVYPRPVSGSTNHPNDPVPIHSMKTHYTRATRAEYAKTQNTQTTERLSVDRTPESLSHHSSTTSPRSTNSTSNLTTLCHSMHVHVTPDALIAA